jgi:teichuronic acid exporter
MTSLTHRSISGFSWHMLERLAGQAAQFVISIILARLLTPSDFGLIGMLGVFVALAQTFSQVGFGSALIQRKNASQKDLSTVFYFNALMGLILTVGFQLAAPAIASFYDQPALVPITRVSTLSFLIGSLGSVQRVILRKTLNFKRIMYITLFGTVVSGTVGVTLAYHDFGVWALVYQGLLNTLLVGAALWLLSQWRPSWTFSMHSFRTLFGYGSRVWAAQMLDVGFREIYTMVIGKAYTPAALGQFTRAKRLQQLSVENLVSSFHTVLFPMFCQVADQPDRFKRAIRQSLRAANIFSLPILCGLALVAPSLILVVYGPQWTPSVPYFQLMCLALLATPTHQIYNSILLAAGRSGLQLKLSIVKRTISAIALFLTFRYGIEAILQSFIAASYLNTFIAALSVRKIEGCSLRKHASLLTPILFMLITMSVVVHECSQYLAPGLALLLLQSGVGALIYAGMAWVFCNDTARMGLAVVLNLFNRNRRKKCL